MLCIFKQMKKYLLLLLICCSCVSKTGFDLFFDSEVKSADYAIDVPKWLPMLAIPKAAKGDVKRLSKGMKRVKLLWYGRKRTDGQKSFDKFITDYNLDQYLEYQEDNTQVKILSKEEADVFKEIIISCELEEEFVVFGITGKMKKEDFQKAINEINERTK